MKECIIISGGEFCPLPETEKNKYIIACDKGCLYAEKQDIVPDLIIGDFDSYDGSLPEGVQVVRYPAEKDDTDTMIALKTAIERGYDHITVYCGTGGRLDHLYANIQAIVYGAVHGACCRLADEKNEVTAVMNGCMEIPAREGWSLSVFSAGDECRGVNISGTKYTMEDGILTGSFPLGVSNQWGKDGGPARISAAEGILLVIMSKM